MKSPALAILVAMLSMPACGGSAGPRSAVNADDDSKDGNGGGRDERVLMKLYGVDHRFESSVREQVRYMDTIKHLTAEDFTGAVSKKEHAQLLSLAKDGSPDLTGFVQGMGSLEDSYEVTAALLQRFTSTLARFQEEDAKANANLDAVTTQQVDELGVILDDTMHLASLIRAVIDAHAAVAVQRVEERIKEEARQRCGPDIVLVRGCYEDRVANKPERPALDGPDEKMCEVGRVAAEFEYNQRGTFPAWEDTSWEGILIEMCEKR